MSKLKPCPFCGKYPQTVVDDETEEKFGVKCFNCGGSIYPEKETLREAIEAWNRRTSIEPERERGEWIEDYDPVKFREFRYKCSKCGARTVEWADNFCYQCGAYMRGEQDD